MRTIQDGVCRALTLALLCACGKHARLPVTAGMGPHPVLPAPQSSLIPTINDDGYVSVQLLQEVSSLSNQTVQAALNAPVITTREASTRAIVRDGQTVVIGGLIGTSTELINSGVPLLKDIPLLGYLFKRQTTAKNRTELAIFITPYIVRSDAEADALFERARQRTRNPEPGDARTLARPPTAPVKKP